MGSVISPFSTATDMLAALDAGDMSSVELIDLHLDRIDELNANLNAVVVPTPERARDAAKRSDDERAAGRRRALLGLPMTLKESTQIAGLPQSAGIETFRDHVPDHDGPIATSVFAAGACLLGTTNIPVSLGDWQADSPVYGRTNNPWDLERTPGGSTGGGSAALAAGLTPLEIGSDIGGSIRVPAAYCGVYGHRPSETAVPRHGAFPFSERPNSAFLMGVQGPLARSAFDLELAFDVIAGPVEGEDAGWQLRVPAARHEQLADFRVAIMPPLSLVEPASELLGRIDELTGILRDSGATVGEAMPDIDQDAYFHDYLVLLTALTSRGQTRDKREESAQRQRDEGDPAYLPSAEGLTIDAHGYLALLDRRERARVAWREFFRDWDVVVCPTALDAAFPHQTGSQRDRVLIVDGREVPYNLNIVYPMWAIFPGQPATAFPAGFNAAGLPLGLQAIGPYLEDRTTIRFAQLLEREWRGFEAPPGW